MKISSRCMAAPMVAFSLLILVYPLRAATSAQSFPPSSSGNFDGPAELPREHVDSSLKDTPADGKTWIVRSWAEPRAGSLQRFLRDLIQLEAGATFSGGFVIPDKSCDDSHWIIIRTSAS